MQNVIVLILIANLTHPMIPTSEIIIANSRKLLSSMTRFCHYTFLELRELTDLEDTHLCLAICELIRCGHIEQKAESRCVTYCLTVSSSL